MSEHEPPDRDLFGIIASYPQLLHHEEVIGKTPYSVGAWILYIESVDDVLTDEASKHSVDELNRVRDLIGRRAVKFLPKSFKLWKLHWEFVTLYEVGDVLQMWERALMTLNKFPRVWIDYLHFAHSRVDDPTFLRRLANRALEALPVTQHAKIWPVLLDYYKTTSKNIPNETKVCLLRRYLQFNPADTKEIADFFAAHLDKWGEAALLYQELLNDPNTAPSQRKELWMSFAKICTHYPVEDIGIDWDAIVRTVVKDKRFLSDELEGVLWNQLADSWIRRGEFQLARSVFEEAIESVSKVRDFSVLLDAYLRFEEGLLEAIMENQPDDVDQEANEGETNEDEGDWDILVIKNSTGDDGKAATSSMSDLELALARAEDLTARRPLLLNRVLLRQNPSDVGEWLKRARLYLEGEQPKMAAAALEEALTTVVSRRAFGGNPNQLVLELAKIYEDSKLLDNARDLFDRICNQNVFEFKHTDDLAECHAAWVEFELRHEKWDDALDIVRRSVVTQQGTSRVVRGLSKCLRLWDLLLDLEESLGTLQTTKDSYNRAFELRVATPLHILNFASFLWEKQYFEESFSAYERGIELFEYPAVKAIWKAYVEAFLKRYGGSKIERTRDLFQRCVDSCPEEEAAEFFIMYGAFEEEHGLSKRALRVYRQMSEKVPPSEKLKAYQLLVLKTRKYLGLTATRDVYQGAIEALDDNSASQMCVSFAEMETSLQEIDRARAIFAYGAQVADPRVNTAYWASWKDFEVTHGNEETFREMLRVKRSVEASFSTVNYNAAEMGGGSGKVENLTNEEAMKLIAAEEGVELEPESQSAASGFVSAKRKPAEANLEDVEARVAKLRKATEANQEHSAPKDGDEDEIDIDDLEDDEDDEKDPTSSVPVVDVSTKSVPKAVFGGLANVSS